MVGKCVVVSGAAGPLPDVRAEGRGPGALSGEQCRSAEDSLLPGGASAVAAGEGLGCSPTAAAAGEGLKLCVIRFKETVFYQDLVSYLSG